MTYNGTAAVLAEVKRRTGTAAELRITGGSAETDLAGNSVCTARMNASAQGASPSAVLSVLYTLAQAAAGASDGDMRISPVSPACAERRGNGCVRYCQDYEIWYRGGL